MTPEGMATVTLSFPGLPEYLLVVRLAISGVASRMGFAPEAIEDVKLAVSEACTYLLEEWGSEADQQPELQVSCLLQREGLTIDVTSKERPPLRAVSPLARRSEPTGLGMLIMQCVMDEVELIETSSWPCIRMVKRRAEPAS